MISMTRAKAFQADVEVLGFDVALAKWGLKHESGHRYLRAVKATGKNNAKVLVFDIETAPMEVYVWGLYKQRISPESVIKDFFVISWAAKWLYSEKLLGSVVTPSEAIARDDKRILKEIWQLFEEADIVIAHNGAKFDIRKLNARFIANGMKPTLPYRVIDTLKHSRSIFGFSSHRLGYLLQEFGLTPKLETGYQLWLDCVAGKEDALSQMFEYNKQDVVGLEDFYTLIRPWIKSHPNIGLYVDTDKTVCPNCGSDKIDWGGVYSTNVSKFTSFRCINCGAIGRSRQTSVSKEKRESLGVSIAR